jgi:predicted nucleic-acid-binding protein
MRRGGNPEFKQAVETAKKVYQADQADYSDSLYLHGILVLDRGKGARPLLAVLGRDHAISEGVDLEKYVGDFSGNNGGLVRDSGVDIEHFPYPKKKVYKIDPDLSEAIQASKEIEVVGGGYSVIELADPNFRLGLKKVQSWYEDPNLPSIRNNLASIGYPDYLRWDLATDVANNSGELKGLARAWRRLENDDNLGGRGYKKLVDGIVDELHDFQSGMEEIVLDIVNGNVPRYIPTEVLIEAATVIRDSGILEEHYRPMGYGDNFPTVYLDRLAAPPLVRDRVMALYLQGRSKGLNRNMHMAAAEVTRLIAIRQLSS